MKHVAALIGIIILACAPEAWAQCSTGVNTGGGNCVPPDAAGMPGYNQPNAQPRVPPPVWADRWGAIVVDDGSGDIGVSADKSSKSDAVGSAMRDCQLKGASQCNVVLTYYNQCAALAWGNGARGSANNQNEEDAKFNALSTCQKGGSNCKVIWSACSAPVRVK